MKQRLRLGVGIAAPPEVPFYEAPEQPSIEVADHEVSDAKDMQPSTNLLASYESEDEEVNDLLSEVAELEETAACEKPGLAPEEPEEELPGKPPGLEGGSDDEAKKAAFNDAEIEKGMESFFNEVEALEEEEVEEESKEKASEKEKGKDSDLNDFKLLNNLNDINQRIDESLRKLNEDGGSGDDKKKKKRKKRKREDSDSESKKKKKKYRWKQCKDPKTGKYYFWDTVNNETSWKTPKEPYENYKDRQKHKSQKRDRSEERKRKKKDDRWKPQSSKAQDDPPQNSVPYTPKYYEEIAERQNILALKSLFKDQEKMRTKTKKMILTSFSGIRSQLNSLVKEFPGDTDISSLQGALGSRLEDWGAGALASDYLIMRLTDMSKQISSLAKRKRAEREKREKEREEAIEVVEKPPIPAKISRKAGEPPFKFLRRLYISHYFEDAKTAATEWENEADMTQQGWVDHSCLVIFTKAKKKAKEMARIRSSLLELERSNPEQENLLSVRDIGGDYILAEFTSEESAYKALTSVFKCRLDSPIEAYEKAIEWFPGTRNLFVQFANKEHLANFAKEQKDDTSQAQVAEKLKKKKKKTVVVEDTATNALPNPTTTVIQSTPLPTLLSGQEASLAPNVAFTPVFAQPQQSPPAMIQPASKPAVPPKDRGRRPIIRDNTQVEMVDGIPMDPPSNPLLPATKRKKKRKKGDKFKSKKIGALVSKWESVAEEFAEQDEEVAREPADVARNRQKKAEKWRKAQSGEITTDNPNLIAVGDWKARLKKLG